MNVENHVMPRQDQLTGLLELGGDQPIQMLNLLKFHDVAQYDDPAEPKISGREAYMRYGAPMSACVDAPSARAR